MAKINWQKIQQKDLVKKKGFEIVETEYQQKAQFKKDFPELFVDLGKHKKHKWIAEEGPFGPHAGKAICKTCKGKFITWLSKDYFK